jgi:hypothetical protein
MKHVVGLVIVLLVSAAAGLPIGIIDTIGGTVYDMSTICAGQQRMVYYDPGYGVHVAWTWSEEMTGTAYTDRNVRYNFRSDETGEWTSLDTNYMHSGTLVFPERSGYGVIDLDPVTHCITISRHGGSTIHPSIARDVAPGSGVFEYADGSPAADNFQWPWHAVSSFGTIHVFPITAAYNMGYFRIGAWPQFEDYVGGFDPGTTFPNHLITASKRSGRVAATWNDNGSPIANLYVRKSEDDGLTWQAPEEMPLPDAFGGDTVESVHISSLGALFDREDRYNMIVAIMPVVHDTGYVVPVELWQYCEGRDPLWTRIHRASCAPGHLQAPLGYNTLYAARPKLGQDPATGRFCAIWSQFDSANVETTTNRLRADVWCSTSPDGFHWSPGVNLTGPGSASEMYCDIAPIVNDTMHIVYLADLQAGMRVMGEGIATFNPIMYMKVPVSAVAIGEGRQTPDAGRLTPRLTPNPCRGVVTLSGTEPVVLYDNAGRRAAVLVPGRNDITGLNPGVYFWTTAAGRGKLALQK